ncbi:phytanoyl-CoA dioxygenase family protein [Tengunoibacter tsumagoiensis]|uniref:Phytanoyl-CoA dioxygenase n=1 Tax=Tengunoibacter tsumagoiensis TaxID=2014871 RepID=A0A402AAV5_9CHLR|nr:phytanoyl-CoA dioxygenase family protein [Tengunoibacter tsumagoiensis]GCE16071.1 hypothetical protein KTT_59300 [Tengunoibacter tsumagoiensis]
MQFKVLTDAQIEQFIECGYVHLEEAFSHQQALRAQDFLWQRLSELGINKELPSTWQEPMVHLKETYANDIFNACATPRFFDAIEDLVGPGRYTYAYDTTRDWGWWPVNFSQGADKPWVVPTRGWHWDGMFFRHFIHSAGQGLLVLCLFSDVGPHSGGTVVAEGSHKLVTRFLQNYPEGIELNEAIKLFGESHPWIAQLTGKTDTELADRNEFFLNYQQYDDVRLRVVDTTGKAGDIYLCHPFLFHAASQNHSGIPRFMCNRSTPLLESMQFQRDDNAYSPLELSIKEALHTTAR